MVDYGKIVRHLPLDFLFKLFHKSAILLLKCIIFVRVSTGIRDLRADPPSALGTAAWFFCHFESEQYNPVLPITRGMNPIWNMNLLN